MYTNAPMGNGYELGQNQRPSALVAMNEGNATVVSLLYLRLCHSLLFYLLAVLRSGQEGTRGGEERASVIGRGFECLQAGISLSIPLFLSLLSLLWRRVRTGRQGGEGDENWEGAG